MMPAPMTSTSVLSMGDMFVLLAMALEEMPHAFLSSHLHQ